MPTKSQSKRLKDAEKARKSGCIVKKGRNEEKGPATLGKMIAEGYEHYAKIKVEKDLLSLVNDKISLEIMSKYLEGTGTCNVLFEGVKSSVAVSEKLEITDPEKLKKVLGDRFADLVKVKKSYAPYDRLVDIIEKQEHEDIDAIMDCVKYGDKKARVTYSLAPKA